jgi:acyl-coenzyme A synthetase/AMP-(fatty) acid ligase
MSRNSHPPRNIGLLYDWHSSAERPVFHLDRPFDIAPLGGTRYTVKNLADLVAETSAALYAAGLRSRDRLAIVKDNHYDVVLIAAAAARIGALPAMISPTNSPEALHTLLDRLAPRLILASRSVLAASAAAGRELTSRDSRVITTGQEDAPDGVILLASLQGAKIPPVAPCRDDEPMICTHTSGTTGVPKLVVHSPNTMLGELAKLETRRIPFLSVRPSDVTATCISFVHGRSITWSSAQLGLPPSKVAIISDPDPATAMPMLRTHRPTVMEASPNVFQFWEPSLAQHAPAFERVRAYLNTFDAIHPRTVTKFLATSKRRMAVWGQVWGQSEVGPVSIGLYTRGRLRRSLRSQTPLTSDVGRPFPLLTQVRVVDPQTGRRAKHGEEGLILVKTSGRCLTYLGEEDRHAEKRWADGWWNSGDMGVRGRFGSLRLVDREVDIIPGMSSIAIESLLLERIEDASEVIVLGVPGRKPVPVLSLTHGSDMDPHRWQGIVAGLPAMEDPVVIGWEDFPRTGTWKVRRLDLRQQLFNTKQTYGTGRWT